jgi:hypothetical protein
LRFFLNSAVLTLAILICPFAARADQCTQIRTTIVSQYTATNCTSALGLCTVGSVASGSMAGTTRFSALSVTQGPAPELLFYTGELVITTSAGTLTLRDFGVLNSQTARYFEVQHAIDGTGIYSGFRGMLTSQGLSTATGFEGTLTGMACTQVAGGGRPTTPKIVTR